MLSTSLDQPLSIQLDSSFQSIFSLGSKQDKTRDIATTLNRTARLLRMSCIFKLKGLGKHHPGIKLLLTNYKQ